MDKHLLLKHLHTIITPLRHLISKCAKSVNGVYPDEKGNVQIPIGSIQMQTDWNENDENSAAYVRNRTHYTDAEGAVHPLDDAYIPDTIQRRLTNNPDSLIELIETITLTEDMAIERSAEPDGTPYNFKAVRVRITTPNVALSNAGQFRFCSKGEIVGTSYCNVATSEAVRYWYAETFLKNNYWVTRWQDWSTGQSGGTTRTDARYYGRYSKDEFPTIDQIRFMAALPANATIEIWGVRA